MFLLDTNTLIYFFKGQGRVAEQLLSQPRTSLLLSSIVLYELETGIAKSSDSTRRRQQLNTLTDAMTVVPFGRAEAIMAAQLRAILEKAGTPVGPEDLLIAATAICHRATLVTHNTREFSRIAGLALADWY
jgi:tRNA(fMet)-specific endonuclease VapC